LRTMPVPGANAELDVIWIGERTRPRDRELFPESMFWRGAKTSTRRRVRSPEFATGREDPPPQLQRKDCVNLVSRHNVGAMHPRTLGRPPLRAPVGSNSAFHRNALQRPHHANAFTLIELLVVIAIIAILIGLLFPAFKAVQNQARQAQAKNDLTQIVNAVNAFYTDYGKYPLATNDNTISNNADLSYSLRAIALGANSLVNGVPAINPRSIVFISPPNVKNDTAGNRRSGIGSDGQYYDPWGTPYRLIINGTYDNQIPNPYTADTGAGPGTLNMGVIAWSFGNDVTQGTNFNASDDVISWQ
jgi:prepilin-type N-terminal cleavage/methylation domain-containing protein